MAGIFDPVLKPRAPVDQLFAGRGSAAIDDDEWDSLIGKARRMLPAYQTMYPHPVKSEGSVHDGMVRMAVKDLNGLDMYPGHAFADPEKAIFMKEFSDADAALSVWPMTTRRMRLGDMLKHDELYRHYPDAKNILVRGFGDEEGHPKGAKGYYQPTELSGILGLRKDTGREEALDTITHELQHFIQDREGWPSGGGLGEETRHSFLSNNLEQGARWAKMITEAPSNKERAERDRDLNFTAYENTSGEILARDAARRRQGAEEYYPAYPRDESNSHPHDIIDSLLSEALRMK